MASIFPKFSATQESNLAKLRGGGVALPTQPTTPTSSGLTGQGAPSQVISKPIVTAPQTVTPQVQSATVTNPTPQPTAQQNFTIDVGDTIPSTALSSNTTINDVLARRQQMETEQTQQREDALKPFRDQIDQQNQFIAQLLGTSQPSTEELAAQEQLSGINTATRDAFLNAENQPILGSIVQGQQKNILAAGDLAALPLEEKLTRLQNARLGQQDALSTALQATNQNFQNLLTLQELGQANIFKSEVDQNTGDVYAFVQDPITGEISTQVIGNVGVGSSEMNELLSVTEAQALGVPYGTTRAQAFGIDPQTTAKPTAEQFKAAGFGLRAQEADKIMQGLEGNFTGAASLIGQSLPNIAKSSERQQFEQAQRNFINAVLRRESGAVISPEEFENARLQYFAQPGDSVEVLEQKRQNRAMQVNNLIREGGNAVQQPQGYKLERTADGWRMVSFNQVGGDTNAASIAEAIKKVESGGNYQAKGASGEVGAYQFMPDTWKEWAGQYLGNPNAPMTQQNQDTVAQAKISDLIQQGYNAQEIALIWNGGEPKVKKGVNSKGVAFDSGAYAQKVLNQLRS